MAASTSSAFFRREARRTSDTPRERLARDLGQDGGYVMAGSHHIQSDTPLDNVLALYDLSNR